MTARGLEASPGEVGGETTALVLEASTYRGSVAVVRGLAVLSHRTVAMRGDADERLMPAAADALSEAGVGVAGLARVVCGAGPGSFTSLRIAAALAKGLTTASSTGPRLAAVPSALLVVAGAIDHLTPGRYLVSLDALRGERYAALVLVDGGDGTPASSRLGTSGARPAAARRIRATSAAVRLSTAAVAAWAHEATATIIGPDCGADGGGGVDAWPQARGAVWVWESVHDVDAGSWEPEYGRLAEAEVRRAAAEGPAGERAATERSGLAANPGRPGPK